MVEPHWFEINFPLDLYSLKNLSHELYVSQSQPLIDAVKHLLVKKGENISQENENLKNLKSVKKSSIQLLHDLSCKKL